MGCLRALNESYDASNAENPIKLYYRPHVKWTYYFLLGLASLYVVGGFVFGAFLLSKNQGAAAFADIALIGIILPLGLLLQARFMIRPLAFSFVQIFSDRIELDRLGKKIEFKFEEIEKVNLSSIPYLVGWFTIVAKGKRPYRFTVVLERSELVLDAIFRAKPGIVDQKKFFNYRKTAVSADRS